MCGFHVSLGGIDFETVIARTKEALQKEGFAC